MEWRDLLGLLDPLEAALAAAVVLADGHLDAGELAPVVGATADEVAGALGVLEGAGLVRSVPQGSVIVAHAYLRAAVVDRLDPGERRRLHAALADALAGAGASSALVSAHVESAGDPALALRGIAAAAAAAGDALALGETGAAADLLARIERLAVLLRPAG